MDVCRENAEKGEEKFFQESKSSLILALILERVYYATAMRPPHKS